MKSVLEWFGNTYESAEIDVGTVSKFHIRGEFTWLHPRMRKNR
jgi:hypothetical protein